MKKFKIAVIVTYLLFILNTSTYGQNSDETIGENNQNLKIGVLVPLSGKYNQVGRSVLNAVKLAVIDLKKTNIQIYPMDSKANPKDSFLAAKNFEKIGVDIVIGPIFYESLTRLNEVESITFISLTNKTQNLPKNVIALGINIQSQFDAIIKYISDNKITKTLLLLPKTKFVDQIQYIIENKKLKFYKIVTYSADPEKITADIEKITKYKKRKINLKARIKKLEKSDLQKDIDELEKLKQKYTLGGVDFNSVVIADFGERLKSVLTSFTFTDVTSRDVKFFTLNQWFNESFFGEQSFQELIFPSINQANFKSFNNKYTKQYKEKPMEISILAYDALALIYLNWDDNRSDFKVEKFSSRAGFKGMHSEFIINNNISKQKLNIYKISENKFIKLN